MCAILISKALGLARVNVGLGLNYLLYLLAYIFALYKYTYLLTFFLTYTVLPATKHLSTYGKSHHAFTPQPQNITTLWLVLISRPAEGRRLSWHGWPSEIGLLRWFARPNTVTHPLAATAGIGNRFGSPTP